jgi:hypothetical protein
MSDQTWCPGCRSKDLVLGLDPDPDGQHVTTTATCRACGKTWKRRPDTSRDAGLRMVSTGCSPPRAFWFPLIGCGLPTNCQQKATSA